MPDHFMENGLSGSFMKDMRYLSPLYFLTAKEEAKGKKGLAQVAMQQQAQIAEQEKEKTRIARETAAMEALRKEVQGILSKINSESVYANREIVHARELAILPDLAGDSVLDQVDEELAALEVAIVQVEAGTVAAMASLDAHKLAVSRADARGAMTAVRGVRSRAKNVVDILEGRLEQIRLDRIRVEDLRASQERQREESLAQQQEEEERQSRAVARRQATENLKEIQRLDGEIYSMRRELAAAKERLVNTRSRVLNA